MIRPALLAFALALAPLPALAGAAEDAYLAKLVGLWTGAGKLTGGETAAINCRLTVRQVSAGVNFAAKCDVEDLPAQNFSGVISYNDGTKKYEAKSPGGDITIGTRSGSTLTFTGKVKGIAEGTSTMKLSPSRIIVATDVRRPGGTADIKSTLELKR
jgi:hypothetical protein